MYDIDLWLERLARAVPPPSPSVRGAALARPLATTRGCPSHPHLLQYPFKAPIFPFLSRRRRCPSCASMAHERFAADVHFHRACGGARGWWDCWLRLRFLLPFLVVDHSRMDGHELFGAIISAPRLPQRASVAENEKTVFVVSAKLFCQGSPSPERRVCFGAVSPRK